MNVELLTGLLIGCALAQFAIAILNLFLVRMMNWQADIMRMPLLIREVFYVHSWFITATLLIFAIVTFRFTNDFVLRTHLVFQWLAFAIGCFWGFRTILQVTYYSSSHWRGQLTRTIIHGLLLLIYGGFAFTYLWTAIQ